jgi:hypothetical protein
MLETKPQSTVKENCKRINYYYLNHPYKGKRLFKHDTLANVVIQVVVYPGEEKKGKGRMIGVYRISENTLIGNYLWNYKKTNPYNIKKTTKKLFEHYANWVLDKLLCKNEIFPVY